MLSQIANSCKVECYIILSVRYGIEENPIRLEFPGKTSAAKSENE